ncbi:unnamed protein product [Cladocopium goreaui]|uniref:Peridinin-chlorophyll a-binding protein, chloroplastic (PCP) n=1 Tax=Cladocopium goreaui TaxID=2562237 RepID=A0A9P1DE51_9DINO|nr:unnamed protein product [Cladocopium goreaui]
MGRIDGVQSLPDLKDRSEPPLPILEPVPTFSVGPKPQTQQTQVLSTPVSSRVGTANGRVGTANGRRPVSSKKNLPSLGVWRAHFADKDLPKEVQIGDRWWISSEIQRTGVHGKKLPSLASQSDAGDASLSKGSFSRASSPRTNHDRTPGAWHAPSKGASEIRTASRGIERQKSERSFSRTHSMATQSVASLDEMDDEKTHYEFGKSEMHCRRNITMTERKRNHNAALARDKVYVQKLLKEGREKNEDRLAREQVWDAAAHKTAGWEWKTIAVGVAVAAACCLQRHLTFVPGPRHAAPVAAAAASMMMAPAAFADEIGDAAKKLGDASYSFAKEVGWNNGIFLQAPGKFQPLEALKAIDKMIEMGAAADPKLLKEAAEAHHKAIGSISGPNGVTSRADWDAVNAALGRVIASVPKAKVMAVYDSVKAITDPGVPAYMKSLVNGPDAEKAYQGFLEFKDVVEKNQVATASAPAVVPSGDKIGEAAKALSDASYPFIKDIDWLSDVYLKPLPGKTAPETLQAIDKMIVMGAKMDGNLLKAAAEAHHKAIGSIDATGVTSAADYEAVNAAIGRLVASVPKSTVMDVYNSMAKVVDSSVPNNMFSKVNPLDAVAAAKGFYTFKDVVEASQR